MSRTRRLRREKARGFNKWVASRLSPTCLTNISSVITHLIMAHRLKVIDINNLNLECASDIYQGAGEVKTVIYDKDIRKKLDETRPWRYRGDNLDMAALFSEEETSRNREWARQHLEQRFRGRYNRDPRVVYIRSFLSDKVINADGINRSRRVARNKRSIKLEKVKERLAREEMTVDGFED